MLEQPAHAIKNQQNEQQTPERQKRVCIAREIEADRQAQQNGVADTDLASKQDWEIEGQTFSWREKLSEPFAACFPIDFLNKTSSMPCAAAEAEEPHGTKRQNDQTPA
jgi:hypothetical protein